MRDMNLTYSQFNIQLEKSLKEVNFFSKFLREAVVTTPTFLEEFKISYPRDYRLLRCLSIVQWFLPEVLHWRILLDLKDMRLSQLNQKQRIEINILLSSKDNCLKYLFKTKRYSSFELFGNILKNDLTDLKRSLKISRIKFKLKFSQRKRGYDDKGSRKPDWKWLPDSDFSMTEYQNEKERLQYLELKTINRILKILENV